MGVGRWYLLTHLPSLLQALLAFIIQSLSILFLWISLVVWDSQYLLASGLSVPCPSCTSIRFHHYSLHIYPPHWVIIYDFLSSITQPHTFILHLS